MRKLIFFLFFFLSLKGYAVTYYFSVSGSDSFTITQAQNKGTPWRSVTQYNKFMSGTIPGFAGIKPLPGDSLLFKRSETFFSSTGLIINTSGTSTKPIITGVWGNGTRPTITSLIDLTFFNVSGNIWRSNETISLPSPSLNCVTVNNVITQRARWPKSTWNTDSLISSVVISGVTFWTMTQKAANGQLTGQPSFTTGAEPANIMYRPVRFWIDPGVVTDHSLLPSRITFTKIVENEQDPDAPNWGYFVQNDSTILTSSPYQNAWYWKKNKYLKVYSVGSPSNFSAATSSNLITTVGSFSWLVFDSLNFNGCNGDNIYLNHGSDITIQDCLVQNSGRNGIKMLAPNINIIRDSVVNSSSKGITTGAGADHCNIRYNIVRNQGQIIGNWSGNVEDGHANGDGIGIYILDNSNDNMNIEYNTVVNSGYSGIQFGRQDSIVIRYNFIDSFCNVADDGGGIYSYTGNSTTQFGRKEIKNIITHGISAIPGQPASKPAVKGIYMDEETNHVIADSNTIAYSKEDGLFANWGTFNNQIRNNTIFACDTSDIHFNTRSANPTSTLTATNNLCYMAALKECGILLHTNGSNLTGFGTINSNQYIKPLVPITSATLFRGEVANSSGGSQVTTNYSYASWRSTFPMYDASSTLTPYFYSTTLGQTDSLIFRFNLLTTAQTTSLPGTYRDIFGTTYIGSVTIQPFSSVILFLISSSIPMQNNRYFIIRRPIRFK